MQPSGRRRSSSSSPRSSAPRLPSAILTIRADTGPGSLSADRLEGCRVPSRPLHGTRALALACARRIAADAVALLCRCMPLVLLPGGPGGHTDAAGAGHVLVRAHGAGRHAPLRCALCRCFALPHIFPLTLNTAWCAAGSAFLFTEELSSKGALLAGFCISPLLSRLRCGRHHRVQGEAAPAQVPVSRVALAVLLAVRAVRADRLSIHSSRSCFTGVCSRRCCCRFLTQLYKTVTRGEDLQFPIERAIANFVLEVRDRNVVVRRVQSCVLGGLRAAARCLCRRRAG